MPTDEILFVGDFLSALRALESPRPQNTIIQHVQKTISSTDKIYWVPMDSSSRTGIYGNERVDKAATSATSVSKFSKLHNKTQ